MLDTRGSLQLSQPAKAPDKLVITVPLGVRAIVLRLIGQKRTHAVKKVPEDGGMPFGVAAVRGVGSGTVPGLQPNVLFLPIDSRGGIIEAADHSCFGSPIAGCLYAASPPPAVSSAACSSHTTTSLSTAHIRVAVFCLPCVDCGRRIPPPPVSVCPPLHPLAELWDRVNPILVAHIARIAVERN
jgi:hypothetical protein